MEISCMHLSFTRPISAALPLASSHSAFFNKTHKSFYSRSLVLGKSKRCRTERAQKALTCNALFGLGVPELVVIAGVAALVFGPKQLPEVGRSIGKTVKSFQQAAKEFESELEKDPESESESWAEKSAAISEKKDQDLEVSRSKESM